MPRHAFGHCQQISAYVASDSGNNRSLETQLGTPSISTSVIRCGGAISWHTSRTTSLRPRATLGERFDFVRQSEGWLATDEMTFALNRIRHTNAQFCITPIACYVPHADEFQFDADQVHIPNVIRIMLGSHWVGVEINRSDEPIQVRIQTPSMWVNRVTFFVRSLLHIPAHRLNIQEPAYDEISGMCGWSLLWRWMHMLGRQRVFAQVERDFATLSIDRRRIIDRTLQHSINHWFSTNCTPDLQQMAYVMRRSFLINLLQLQTSVHATMDSKAVMAIGHPLSCFEPSVGFADPPQIDPAIANPVQGGQEQPVPAQALSQEGATQTEMSMANLHTFLHPPGALSAVQRQPIVKRLEASLGQPNWAGSDELDAMSALYQPFVGQCLILPCMQWDATTQAMHFVSGRGVTWDLRSLIYCMIACGSHWIGVKIVRQLGFAYGQVFAADNFAPDEWNSFVHSLTQFLQLPFGETRMQLVPTVAPEGMCGYFALFAILQDAQCMLIPDTEHVILRLQLCDHASVLIDIANHALEMWYGVSKSCCLEHFCFCHSTSVPRALIAR